MEILESNFLKEINWNVEDNNFFPEKDQSSQSNECAPADQLGEPKVGSSNPIQTDPIKESDLLVMENDYDPSLDLIDFSLDDSEENYSKDFQRLTLAASKGLILTHFQFS